MRGLEMRHHPSPHRPVMVVIDGRCHTVVFGHDGFPTTSLLSQSIINNVFEVGDGAVAVDQESLRGLEMHHHPSPHRPVMVTTQTAVYTNAAAALGQQRRVTGFNVVSNSEVPLVDVNVPLENYHHARYINLVPATLYLVRGIIDHIERCHPALEASDGSARPIGHSEPSSTIISRVGDRDAAIGGGWRRNGWASANRLFRGGGGASNPPEAGNGVARPSVHSEPSATIISGVGDRDAAAGGGWCRNGWASASRLFRGGGGANNPFWMSPWRELSSTLRILGIGDINNLKVGSLAFCLIPFFVDKQPPLNAQDAIYLRIAFCCGVSAFLIVPLRVPGAESTRVARNRQVIGVTTLITGAVIFMVTAVDEKLRLLVLFLVFACILFSLYLEKREANETQLLPL